MDILHLVDRLELLITQSRLIPFTAYRLVDEDRVLELVDQMRLTIPDEVKKAKRIYRERDRIIAQTHEEADRLVALAKEEAEGLVQRDAISAMAERRAHTVVERAQRDAEVVKTEADEYVVQVLGGLEANLMRSLTVVRNGLDKLDREKQEAAAAANSEQDGQV